ncbi:MAG: enoyl-CoA hydratase-related protein [Hyphomonadaceae bacterium]
MSEAVLYEVRGGAAWITLNQPDNRNALSEALLEGLKRDLGRALADPVARSIVITGAGKAFCAGADLKGARPGVARTAGPSPFVEILSAIWDAPKPVIAAINGPAFAGGLGLVAACDIVVAAESARFSFSEVRIGVIPAVISVVCVPKLGAHQAMRLFLTGETFSAADAVRYGLVHRTAPDAALRAEVEKEIDAIRKGGPQAVAESKRLVRRVAGQALEEAFAWTQTKSAEMFASDEAKEGMAAFREKRTPRWIEE